MIFISDIDNGSNRVEIMTYKKSCVYIKIFLLTFLLVPLITVVNSGASCIISIEDVKIPEKSKTWDKLMISEVTNLGSFSINLSWNPSIVNIDKISGSDFVLIPYINNSIGFVNITAYTISAVNGNVDIADILFEAVGSSGSSCSLKITHCQLYTADPLPEVIDCSYNVNLTTITITEAVSDNNKNDTLTQYTVLSETKEEEDNIFWYTIILIMIIILIIIGAVVGRKTKPKKKSKE